MIAKAARSPPADGASDELEEVEDELKARRDTMPARTACPICFRKHGRLIRHNAHACRMRTRA